jgi:hypothetical protein
LTTSLAAGFAVDVWLVEAPAVWHVMIKCEASAACSPPRGRSCDFEHSACNHRSARADPDAVSVARGCVGFTVTGLTPQMSCAYSSTVRSLEKFPI